jgi:hypothetical protein
MGKILESLTGIGFLSCKNKFIPIYETKLPPNISFAESSRLDQFACTPGPRR